MTVPNPMRSSKRHKFNVYLYHTGNESHSSLPYAARQVRFTTSLQTSFLKLFLDFFKLLLKSTLIVFYSVFHCVVLRQ